MQFELLPTRNEPERFTSVNLWSTLTVKRALEAIKLKEGCSGIHEVMVLLIKMYEEHVNNDDRGLSVV